MAAESKPGIFSRMMGGIVGGLIGAVTGAVIGAFKGVGQAGSFIFAGGDLGALGMGLVGLALLPAMAVGAVFGMGFAAYQGIKNGVQNGFAEGCKSGASSALTWEDPKAVSASASASAASAAPSAEVDAGVKKPVKTSPAEERSRDVNRDINKDLNVAFSELNEIKKTGKIENLKNVEEKIAAIKEKSLGIELSSNNKAGLKNIETSLKMAKGPDVSAAQVKTSSTVSEPVAAVKQDYEAPRRKM